MSGDTGGKIETERKYRVRPEFRVPSLAGLPAVAAVSEPCTHQLTALYFDTAGLRLAAARVTLRRRTGGTDPGWHLKLPAGEDTRREVHAPLGPGNADLRGGREVPGELATMAARWSGGLPLRPIARLHTTRVVRDLTDRAGQTLAEVADDRVTGSLPASGAPAREDLARPEVSTGWEVSTGQEVSAWQEVSIWREVEVELGAGSRELLDAVGDRLLRAGAEPAVAGSKLALLLGAAGIAPEPADTPEV